MQASIIEAATPSGATASGGHPGQWGACGSNLPWLQRAIAGHGHRWRRGTLLWLSVGCAGLVATMAVHTPAGPSSFPPPACRPEPLFSRHDTPAEAGLPARDIRRECFFWA